MSELSKMKCPNCNNESPEKFLILNDAVVFWPVSSVRQRKDGKTLIVTESAYEEDTESFRNDRLECCVCRYSFPCPEGMELAWE